MFVSPPPSPSPPPPLKVSLTRPSFHPCVCLVSGPPSLESSSHLLCPLILSFVVEPLSPGLASTESQPRAVPRLWDLVSPETTHSLYFYPQSSPRSQKSPCVLFCEHEALPTGSTGQQTWAVSPQPGGGSPAGRAGRCCIDTAPCKAAPLRSPPPAPPSSQQMAKLK